MTRSSKTLCTWCLALSMMLGLCLVCSQPAVATTLVLYPTNLDHASDGKASGALNGQAATFEYQYTYHVSSQGQKDFKANYVRFAADGPVDVNLTVNASINTAHLRTVGKDLPFTRTGSNFQFTLPGPGTYYLQLPDLNTAERITYTVFFMFDDLDAYNSYQQAFAAAKDVKDHGVVSHSTLDQTSAIQSILNAGGTVYFPQGIYRTRTLNFTSNTTVYLAPGAVLKGTDTYNDSRYLYINGRSNVRIAGLGTIDANGHTSTNMQTKGHGLDMESSADITLEDLVFRDSNSWMLHIRRCDRVNFDRVKVFSGKDGIDPDGSRDVTIERALIQSIDDGFAVKSKFSGRSCERVTMRDCIVFSCASSLKIGTENYYGSVRDITWDRCDAVDADRGCILYTKPDTGDAPVSNITWSNIRVFNFPWAVERGGSPFQFHNESGCSVSGLMLSNIEVDPEIDCSLYGSVSATFRNIIMNGSSSIGTSGMTFQGVIWPGVTSQSKPVVFIDPSPRNQNEYCNGDDVTFSVQHPYGKAITRVDLFVDNIWSGQDTSAPWSVNIDGLSLGSHTLKAVARDTDGQSNLTAEVRIEIVPSPAPPVQITSGPTTSGITQNAATVQWTTNPAGNSIVEYGPTVSYGSTVTQSAAVTNHSMSLTGLTPGTTYHYRVRTQAIGYLDGVSADSTFTTQIAPGTLRNPGFENGPAQTAWIKYGEFDSGGNSGIQSGPWFGMMPHSGIYLAGSAASGDNKNGGFYQTVSSGIEPGQYWLFAAWCNTFNDGSSSATNTNNRIGIDPYGGNNPYSDNIVWSPRVSTQYQWQKASVGTTATANAITLFVEAEQKYPVAWNLNAFDDCAIISLNPMSIAESLTLPDGAEVSLMNRLVTAGTDQIGGAFYVEESDRSAGIQVASYEIVEMGSEVTVSGVTGTNAYGERCIYADMAAVNAAGQDLPGALFVSNAGLGGGDYGPLTQGPWQGLGVYNVGLLVTCFGEVTAQGSGYFYIDDGAGLEDGSGRVGVMVDAAGLVNPAETYAMVTGISTLRLVGGKSVRALRSRVQSDIVGIW